MGGVLGLLGLLYFGGCYWRFGGFLRLLGLLCGWIRWGMGLMGVVFGLSFAGVGGSTC